MPAEAKYTETELVQALLQRSSPAFDHLYDSYSGVLYGSIFTLVEDREVAADILQETFIKIWKQIGSYDPSKGRLFTWMIRIGRNTAIDMLRSRGYRQDSQNFSLDESVYESAITELKVEQIGLRKLVSTLKPEQRALVELAYFEGYTHAEIAIKMNIPEGTVKTRLRAGLIQLRQLMKEVE